MCLRGSERAAADAFVRDQHWDASGEAIEFDDARTDGRSSRGARLVRSDELTLESEHPDHVVVVNRRSAQRLQLSRPLYQFVRAFDTPRRVQDIANGAFPNRFLSQLSKLIAKGLLIDVNAPAAAHSPKLRSAVPYKFCNAPSYRQSAAAANFVVLGIPYDLAGDCDCRMGPAAIRQKSLDYTYEVEFASGRPQGWFDVNRCVRILEGASIADAGDIHVAYGASQRDLFERIGRVLEELCQGSDAVPVILGGDRSVTYAVARQLCKAEPLTVIQIAMTPAIARQGLEDTIAADDLGTRLLEVENIRKFVSLGGSDPTTQVADGSQRLALKDAAALRQMSHRELVRELNIETRVHLSIDLSVATVEYARPNAEGNQRGLALHELKELIASLGASYRIVSIDLVGLDMRSEWHPISTITACHLALAAMSAARGWCGAR